MELKKPHAEQLRQAPLLDIMIEQLISLATHSQQVCDGGCRECIRLWQVQKLLLQCFHDGGSDRQRRAA